MLKKKEASVSGRLSFFRINAFIRKCTDFHKQILTINLKSITMKKHIILTFESRRLFNKMRLKRVLNI